MCTGSQLRQIFCDQGVCVPMPSLAVDRLCKQPNTCCQTMYVMFVLKISEYALGYYCASII